MSKVLSYFEEKVNSSLLDLESLEHRLKLVDAELRELDNQSANIDEKMSDSDFVFNVDLYNNSLNDDTLKDISEQKDSCMNNKKELEAQIISARETVRIYKELYEEAKSNLSFSSENGLITQLEFVKKLIDTEPQRAKIEIDRILKEEN